MTPGETPIDVSIVIPTYNERDGIAGLVATIFEVFEKGGLQGEVVLVDDNSPDGTGDVAEGLKAKYRVQVLHRAGKLGLSSAVIDGFKLASSDILGVMDADGSHDAAIIPKMVEAVKSGRAELAVGSRYVPGGGTEDWPQWRVFASQVAVMFGHLLSPIRDITSGFFVFRRDIIEGVTLSPIGFKILLEIAARGNFKTYVEVPFTFHDRVAGKSKFNQKEVMNYFKQILSLWSLRAQARSRRAV